jgi:phosphodiesterase/alkaline phosphatase D-like protein
MSDRALQSLMWIVDADVTDGLRLSCAEAALLRDFLTVAKDRRITIQPERNCYYRFDEYNDHEGETWSFFIPVRNNKTLVSSLKKLLKAAESIGDDNGFSISDEILTEAEVDTLVKYGDCGYMDRYNKLTGVLDLSALEAAESSEEFVDLLYKGGIQDMMQET